VQKLKIKIKILTSRNNKLKRTLVTVLLSSFIIINLYMVMHSIKVPAPICPALDYSKIIKLKCPDIQNITVEQLINAAPLYGTFIGVLIISVYLNIHLLTK
jgi:hypothetical protein